MNVPTVGAEEEFLLLDPRTASPLDCNREVAATSESRSGIALDLELTACQVETTSPVVTDMEDLAEALATSRAAVGDASARHGALAVPMGVAPVHRPGEVRTTVADDSRYRRIAERFGPIADQAAVCGCHVHVAVQSRAHAVAVATAVRPWLPTLLAVSANSPIYDGVDTGYASWRSVQWSRWPSAGPPPHLRSEAEYDREVSEMIRAGTILDDGMVYWDVRPSRRLPTVEIRVADVPADSADTVLLARLIRALVMSVDPAADAPVVPDSRLRRAYWLAAHDGLDGDAVDPASGIVLPAASRLADLVAHVRGALTVTGDLESVETHIDALLARGNGARRQREMLAAGSSVPEVATSLAVPHSVGVQAAP